MIIGDSLALRYDGGKAAAREMDSYELAEAIRGFSDFTRLLCRRLYGQDASIETTVRPFHSGSFEIEFLYRIISPDNLDVFVGGLVSPSELLKIFKETISLFKHLGGSPAAKIEPAVENRCNVENNHGVVIQCQRLVVEAALDREIGVAAESFVRRPLRTSAQSVEITADDSVIAQIQQSESENFRPLAQNHESTENRSRSLLKIKTVVFEGRRKWRFSDGSSSFSAEVEDEEFLSRVRSGEERFGKGDTLLVDLRTIQIQQNGGLRCRHVVERVIGHSSSRSTQMRLL